MSDGLHTKPDAPHTARSASYTVASLAALRAAKSMRVQAGGRLVALFALGDEVVATNGRCPHAHGPLHQGEIEGEMLTCPWHGWTFNLRNGACEEDPSLVLEIYPTHLDGDDVTVTLG